MLFRLGVDLGGEPLAELTYSDGAKAEIAAGQGFMFTGGLIFQPVAPWSIEATFGYKTDPESGSNGRIGFRRFPLDVVASLAPRAHRLGIGLTVHFSPLFYCTGTVCGGSEVRQSWKTAVGFLAQYAYRFRRGPSGFDLGVRYTRIHYSDEGLVPVGVEAREVNGISLGLFAGTWL